MPDSVLGSALGSEEQFWLTGKLDIIHVFI